MPPPPDKETGRRAVDQEVRGEVDVTSIVHGVNQPVGDDTPQPRPSTPSRWCLGTGTSSAIAFGAVRGAAFDTALGVAL